MKKTAKQKLSTANFLQLFSRLPIVVLFMACLLTAAVPAFAQQQTIRGRITTETGDPVIGATVQVKGASGGTSTNSNGEFTIAAARGAVLVISSVGFAGREITVADDTQINIQLTAAAEDFAEVVVVGYGTQRKEAVTGSVASISGNVMREVPSPNIAQALQGRLPGVEMSQTSTRPGATMQIRVRGARSLSANNDPLVVLDGIPFPGSIADINPNDIKSIDILKDASATAIYGSRGANGVILITTNRGQRGGDPRISYNGYYGAQTVFAKFPMMSGPEFVALRTAAGQYTNGIDEADDVNTDWQDLFFKTGAVTDNNISLSGGTGKGSYNFGLGYYQNQGVIPTQQYKRFALRASIDQDVGKYFRVGFTTNSNYNVSEGNQLGIGNILSMSPIVNPYNPDGTLKRVVQMPLDQAFVLTGDLVEDLRDQDLWLNETRGYATYNALYGEVKIPGVEGLKYRVNLGLDYIQTNNGAYTGRGINSVNEETESAASVDNRHTFHWTLENLLTYDRTFGQKHNLNVVALYSAEQNKYNRSNMSARDVPSDAFQFYNLGQAAGEITIDPDNQDYQLWGLMSMMGRVMYSYDDRYMISATVRSDGSSRLAPGNKWHTYPAISAGWNISNEAFMQNVPVLNRLKLRVGYGETSNQSIAPYATLGRLSTRPYNFGNENYATGYYVTQLPNENLGWEYSETWNFGLDFAILNHRLTGTIEYYITNTKDILLGLGLPPTSGVSSYTANIGETQNKGLELSLNGIILDDQNGWTWEAGVNLYANRNKLVSLASGQTRDEDNAWFVGHNINALFDYEKIGLWQDKDPHRNILEPGTDDQIIGSIKVKYTGEFNPDGTPVRAIGPEDRQIIDVDPDFQGGFHTSVSYKGFSLNVVGFYKSGGILISTLYGPTGYLNLMSGRRNNVKVDYWTPENTGAKYPRPSGIRSGDNPRYASTLAYFDASFMKIRTISLGYDFSRSLIRNSDVNMRMYFTVQNPFVLFSPYHKESGMDPETNSFGNENAAVNNVYERRFLTVGANTPSTRNYVIGVNLTF